MMEKNTLDNQEKFDQFSEIVEARTNLYHFFSSFYLKPPTKSSLDALKDTIATPAVKEMFDPSSIAKIEDSLKYLGKDGNRIIQEFHNLFLVPGSQYVTPYESCYREKRMKKGKPARGLLMGKATRAVIKFYRENGLEVSKEFKDLPDHIVLELHLMGVLCQQEKKAWEAEDCPGAIESLKKERQFLNDHLIHWIPDLCEEIGENSTVPLYQGIAEITCEFIEMEHNTFDSITL
jgi:TorA maturation chaperone TorD